MSVLGMLLEGFAPAPKDWGGRVRVGDRVRVQLAGKDSIQGRILRPDARDPEKRVVIAPEGGGPHVVAEVGKVSLDSPQRHHAEKVDREERDAQRLAKLQPQVKGNPTAVVPPAKGVKVSESILDVLLEGFDDAAHPRGWHGRWIRGRGGKPGRLEGSYNGVKLERGRAYQGRLATGEVFTGHWTGELDHGQEPIFRHVDDPTIKRTFRNGSDFSRLSDVKV